MSSKSDLKDHQDLSCEYEPYTLPNINIGAAKDHGKNYIQTSSTFCVKLSIASNFGKGAELTLSLRFCKI